MIANSRKLSIYVHWPFCKTKCPYCNFNSHARIVVQHDQWEDAFLKEIEFLHTLIENKKITSIFFGGGTPSLMKPKTVDVILKKINFLAEFCEDIEITLEANPNSIERKKFIEFKAAGINRISIGIQSFNNHNLKFLGRLHRTYDSLKALEVARSVFKNYSFDLMYCLPNQKVIEWEKELNTVLQYIDYHISCYQLTIDKGTNFFLDLRSNIFNMPQEQIAIQMYILTHDILQSHGIHQYEISNYSRSGYSCRHNVNYWRLNNYVGIGPGAHSRYYYNDCIYSTINYYDPKKWYQYLRNNKYPLQHKKKLTQNAQLFDKLTMGLRLNQGVPISYISNTNAIKALIKDDFLTMNTSNLVACTLKGRLILNYLIKKLI